MSIQVISIPPFHYVEILNKNTNKIRLEEGPKNLPLKEDEEIKPLVKKQFPYELRFPSSGVQCNRMTEEKIMKKNREAMRKQLKDELRTEIKTEI